MIAFCLAGEEAVLAGAQDSLQDTFSPFYALTTPAR